MAEDANKTPDDDVDEALSEEIFFLTLLSGMQVHYQLYHELHYKIRLYFATFKFK